MERPARINSWPKYLLITILTLYCGELFAQNEDLRSYSYYRLYETAEELAEVEEAEEAEEMESVRSRALNRLRNYHLKISTKRGAPFYEYTTTLNGLMLPYVGRSSMWKLQLSQQEYRGISEQGLSGGLELRIDSIKWVQGDVGIRFRSRNMPYSLNASTAHRFKRGWSLAATINARTGRDIFVEGVYGNTLDVRALAMKEITSDHKLSFALFVAPTMRSVRSMTNAEAFRLMGNNLYNPAWGYQDGKVRSSRVRRETIPTIVAAYGGVLSESTRLDVTASLALGIKRYSSLDWFGTQTPMPDNYHYMPSYFLDEPDIFSTVEMAWLCNDTRYTQIDFDGLILSNKLYGGEALYAISDRVERISHVSLRGLFTTKIKHGEISYGLEVNVSNSRKYKQMRDLLGADYIFDLDYFLRDDSTLANSMENNLNAPSRLIREGDRFGYDYALRRNEVMAHGVYHYAHEGLKLDISAQVGYTGITRKGFFRKELFADNSYGVSRRAKFAPYALCAKGEYMIGRSHLVGAKLLIESKAVDGEDIFLQSQYNNRLIDNPVMRQGYGAEISYLFTHPKVVARATLFGYAVLNDTQVRHIYDDLSGEYADVVLTNLDSARYGLELEANYNFADNLYASVLMCFGRYQYTDDARVTTYSDSYNRLITDNVASHIKNLSLGNRPQIAISAGLSYRNKGWVASMSASYEGLRYVEPSIAMRTERILTLASSPEAYAAMSIQERLRDAFTLDIYLSKSLYLDRLSKRIYRPKYKNETSTVRPAKRLLFSIGVRNLVGSNNIVDMGVESSRIQRHKSGYNTIYQRQATRYLYAYPRTYEASVSFRF